MVKIRKEAPFIEVGERTITLGFKVKCVESTGMGCNSCVFLSKCSPFFSERPRCFAHERMDRKSVYFLKAV